MLTRTRTSRAIGLSLLVRLMLTAVLWCMAAPAFAQLTVSMTVPPPYTPNIQPGDTTALQITITNGNPNAAITGTGFSLNLRSNANSQITIVDAGKGNGGVDAFRCADGDTALPAGNNGAGLVSAPAGGTTITLSGATIPVRAQPPNSTAGRCVLTVLVTSTLPGGNDVVIPAAAVTGNDGAAQSNSQAAPQTITPAAFTAPTISKSFNVPSIVLGSTATATLTIQNNSSVASLPLNGASATPAYGVRDTLPAGLVVAPTPNPTVSPGCGGATVNAAAGAGFAEVVGGSIAAGGTCVVTFDVAATSTGTKVNTIDRLTDFHSVRGVPPGANASASISVSSSLAVTTSFLHDPVAIDQESEFTVRFENLGGVDLTQSGVFTDIIGRFDISETGPQGDPGEGLIIQGTAPVSITNCPGASIVVAPNGKSYDLSGVTFAAGQTCTITFKYRGIITVDTRGAETFTHFIMPGAVQTTAGVTNTLSSASVNVYKSLLADKYLLDAGGNPITDPALVLGGGQVVRYKLTIGNFGPQAALVVTDRLPGGMQILNVPGFQPTYQGDTADCANVTLSGPANRPVFTYAGFPGATTFDAKRCDIFFYAQVPLSLPDGTDLRNIMDPCDFRIGTTTLPNPTSGGADPSAGTGACALRGTGTVGGFAAPVSISQQFSTPTAATGSPVRLTYTLVNLGGTVLQDAAFTNAFPSGLRVAAVPNVASTCGGTFNAVANATSVSLTGGSVGPRANGGLGTPYGSCTIALDVTGTPGVYTNTIAGGGFTGLQTQPSGPPLPIASAGQPVNATITFEAALNTSKSFLPATIASGGQSRVTITLQNASTGPYNNIQLTDPLPAGMVVAPTPNAATTCPGAPVVTAAAGASSASLSGVILAAGQVCDLQFNVVATGGSNWENRIPVGAITADGGISNVTDIVATLNNSASASVTVVNATLPSSLTAPGQTSTLTVTLTNPGSVTLTNLGLTNYLTANGLQGGAPQGFVIASNANPVTTCVGGTVTVLDNRSFRLNGATLAGGNQSCTFQVDVTLLELGTRTNIIPAGAVQNDQNITNTAQATTNLALSGDIGVVKQFSPTVVRPNVPSRLRVTVYNLLTTAVQNIQFTDTLPAGLVIAPTPNATTTCAGGSITGAAAGGTTIGLTGGQLAASAGVAQICLVEVDVVSATRNAYVNTIGIGGVTGTTNGGTPVQNVVEAEAILQVRDPVVITKAFADDERTPGQANLLTITLANPNSVALTNSSLVDNFPAGVTVAPAPAPAASTTCPGGVVSAPVSATSAALTGATLPANASCVVTVWVRSNTPGAYVNTIPANSLSTLMGVTNELPTSDQFLVNEPPAVAKSFGPPAIAAGGVSTLVIALTNNNVGPATLTAPMTDLLPVSPGAILVAPAPAATSTCLGTAFAPTAGAASVTLPAGAIIPAGGCQLTVDVTGAVQGTHVNTIDAGALVTNRGVNVQPATANLSISPLGVISGRVFRDRNLVPNGLFDGADTGLAGVTLTLTGLDFGPDGTQGTPDDVGTIASRNTTTDALGAFAFTGLNAGQYTVTQASQPAGTVNGITTAGSIVGAGGGATGAASNPTATSSVVANIRLGFAASQVDSSPNNLFAEVPVSSLAGVVFLDLDNDGLKDPADLALAGESIELLDGGGAVVATAVTDAAGAYAFTNIGPGTYTLRQPNQPVGTTDGIVSPGAVGGGGSPGVVAAGPSRIQGLILPPGAASTGNNFAERPAGRQISGRVYLDVNNSGVFDGGDTGIPGQTVVLTGTDINGSVGPVSQLTDAAGQYIFTNLLAGTYTLTQPAQPASTLSGPTNPGSTGGLGSDPAVTPSTIGGVNLTGGALVSTGNNFGERSAAPSGPAPIPSNGSISGRVFIDLDDDGQPSAGEAGLAGVSLRLTGLASNGTPVDLAVFTDAEGGYLFANLPPSGADGYTLAETQPASHADGKTSAPSGALASAKPVAAGAQDTVTGIALGPDEARSGYNFGERPPGAAVRGRIYLDANASGAWDAGDTGLPGVAIRLTGTDTAGAAVDRSLVTDAEGRYAFSGLPASGAAGYTVTQTQPAAYRDGVTLVAAGQPGTAASTKPVAAGDADRITGLVLAAGDDRPGYDFAELNPGAELTGYVFIDADDDGARDVGETGIAGVPIRLSGADATGAAVDRTVQTDAAGRFRFAGLPASGAAGYTLTELQPSGVRDGKTGPGQGLPGQAVSGKPVGVGDQDRITGIVVGATSTLADYLFGEIGVPQLKPPIVNGYVYFDRDRTRVRPTDGTVVGQAGWTVILRQNGTVICTTTTDSRGFYQFDNLHCPPYEVSGLPLGPGYSITFEKDGGGLPAEPTSGGNRGTPVSRQILNITLGPADQVVEQNLPLDPAGVVYDAQTRAPVRGAVVVISGPAGFDPATHLVGGLAARSQVVGSDGMYQFLLQNGFPSGVYTLAVTPPEGYRPGPSTLLPPCTGTLNVGPIPSPALVQAGLTAPSAAVTSQLDPNACPGLVPGGANTTQYYLAFGITNGGSADILNNHIPLDPFAGALLMVTKTTPMVTVSRGDLVPYVITVANPLPTALTGVRVRDQLPAGFRYREGSATRNGQKATPVVSGGTVDWPVEDFAPNEKKTYGLILVVGAGVGDGDYVNRAFVGRPAAADPLSNVATASVRLAPDPTFDCADVIGRVFDDANANGYPDADEHGIPAVRLAAPNGLLITTDAEGRFHVPCPAAPDPDRGSNYTLKLDARTLPTGFRVTTENPREVRLTRGKMARLNFGATIHRVVRIELTDAAFAAGGLDLLPTWRAQLDALPRTLLERPSVVRIAYAPGADAALRKARTRAVREQLAAAWSKLKGAYRLEIEVEETR
ncbi:SdrD B-like domain-containing protein [Phenylobacterium sp. VNQ135]|uniref:DUF7933 domain-containing protein n=1 Tax=Phenylobacterium sp. VNQ135 TaxID=3400922 RepID=UPI003C04F7D5